MDQIAENGFVRVVLLLTPEQARKLDQFAKRTALSRSSFVRMRFDELFVSVPAAQQPEGHLA